jgi:hypothetical protein
VDNFVDSSLPTGREPSKIKGLAAHSKNMLEQESFMNQRVSIAMGFVAKARVKFALQQVFCA